MALTKIPEDEVVVRQQVAGMVNGDLDILNKIIAPDAVFIHITGTKQSKNDGQWQITSSQASMY